MPRKASAQQLELEAVDGKTSPRPQSGEARASRRIPSAPVDAAARPARELERSPRKPEFPRLALTFAESAAVLGVSDEFFAQYVAHEVRFVRRGRKKLVALREVERWLEESASREPI
jgi:hypothetical protein